MTEYFKKGYVKITSSDDTSQMVVIEMCIPCVIFQTISPVLFANGKVTSISIKDPISVWIPNLCMDRFKSGISNDEFIDKKINKVISEKVDDIGKLFAGVASLVVDKNDILPILPLGTYINVEFVSKYQDLKFVLHSVSNIKSSGVSELYSSMKDEFSSIVID